MAFNGELFEIFSRLPAKSVFKLASVAKSCDGFSSEDLFVKKQSRNMVHENDSAFFMQQSSYQMFMGVPEFHVMPGEENSSGVSNKSLDFLKKFGRLLGSSNGLVCCRKASGKPVDNELFICNPATQRWLSIPDPWRFQDPKPVLNVVFQCNTGPSDEFPSDYFLMVLQPTEFWSSDLMCKIYSPAERIWQDRGLINFGARRILFESLVYQKGVFYFLSDWFPSVVKESRFYWPYIVAFDPKEGTSSFLQIPKPARKHDFLDTNLNMGIFKWGQGDQESICLVMLAKGVFTVWALERNESGSWRRILKVRARAMRMAESDLQIAGFTVINGDSLLVATEKRVYRYGLTSHWRWKRAEKVCSHRCRGSVLFYPYSNTLRPCGDGATPVPE